MPLIHQFFVTDEQFEAIEKARKELEPAMGEQDALATIMYTGALFDGAAPGAAPAAKPAAKKPAKRR